MKKLLVLTSGALFFFFFFSDPYLNRFFNERNIRIPNLQATNPNCRGVRDVYLHEQTSVRRIRY